MARRDGHVISLPILCGPTASGKTALALELCDHLGGEIVSADSRQVFRGMDIGTAKPTAEERARVPHHLVDVVDPGENFTTADFVRLGGEAIAWIDGKGRRPMVVGGTGLYIRNLTEGLLSAPSEDRRLRQKLAQLEMRHGEGTLHRRLQETDPELASRLHPRDRLRIVRALEVFTLTGRRLSELQAEHAFRERPYRLLKIGLAPEREELYRRIDDRVEAMLAAGLMEEVAGLLARGIAPEGKALQTIGYRECILHLQGRVSLTEATELIQRNTRRYAKRQLTWFRKDKSIIWFASWRESAKIRILIEQFYASIRSGHGQDPIQHSGPVSQSGT